MLTRTLFISVLISWAIVKLADASVSAPCTKEGEVVTRYKKDPHRSFGSGSTRHDVAKAVCSNPDANDDMNDGEMDVIAKQPDGTEDDVHRGRLSDVRLARGHTLTPNEGFVQVLYSNQWQFVCSRYWSFKLSNMTCHSLGYTTALLPSDGQIAYRADAVAEEVPGILRLVCPRNTRNLTECDVRPITIDTRFMCEDNGIAMVTCQKKDEADISISSSVDSSTMSSEHYEDQCLSNPCSNGGSCISSDGSPGYKCACPNGYEGAQCEITKVDDDRCVSNPCLHGGTCQHSPNTKGYSCKCAEGFLGDTCYKVSSCLGYKEAGYTESGIYDIYPMPTTRFYAYCDLSTDGGGWVVIQRRINGDVLFNLTWPEYQKGFGSLESDHWLGLDNILSLTPTTVELRVTMITWSDPDQEIHSSFNFRVDETYRGHFSDTSFSQLPDILEFSTIDHGDWDCVQMHGGGGYWYDKRSDRPPCTLHNVNGQFGNSSFCQGTYPFPDSCYDKMYWWSTTSQNAQLLKYVEMKIRKI